ncbi:hypothetical protein ACWEU9_04465 [Staphylococcus xylosus]|uniref:hypothetical protein n=1 Tax=Staphylococcus TaxID=1279 RepID=UPI000623CF2C|nr:MULTISPECIES: hypothetical protein [Staphylococcus]KKI53903.1 hypothetical protein UF72_1725 [Staphylococcus equorum subsp. equorum]MCD8863932.1 hypothetical protein [Staphylococcus arlettae]OEK79404.1 hypothetical protein AST16_05805 [Staphylococcus xylosus]QPS99475.1 hypothetical protein I6G41_13590 [Staphylococcus equorum]RIL47136.1 hypothetical protein BUY76_12405 [Staphylococcus equorum]
MYDIPRYTRREIVQLINNKMNGNESGKIELNISKETLDKLLSLSSIWTLKEYHLAASIIGVQTEKLIDMLPKEDLNKISFRAKENNEQINRRIQQLNDIFENLTYQLKIGSEISGRKI